MPINGTVAAMRGVLVQQNSVMLPARYAIDYEFLLCEARLEGTSQLAGCLQRLCRAQWRDSYVAAVERPTNLVQFRARTFEYVFDLYSGLEATGEIPYDQTVEDRVVDVLGTSATPEEPRTGTRMRGWLGE